MVESVFWFEYFCCVYGLCVLGGKCSENHNVSELILFLTVFKCFFPRICTLFVVRCILFGVKEVL